ncbi:MAG: EAL domain-containing protein [Pseudomonadota bacterium]
METHLMTWNILAVLAGVALILYLTILAIRNYRNIKLLQKQLLEKESDLQAELQRQSILTGELNKLQTDFNENVLVDPVTQLPSFKVFEDRLQQTLHQSVRHKLIFAVLYLDIDDFKVINNVLGYEAGDILLKETVLRLAPCIRKVDSMSHIGNDSFAFILPQLSKAETAAYVAQRLLDAISQPFNILDNELFITASIGITVYPIDGVELPQLLKNADIALHQAKSRGRNVFQFYHEDMYALSHRELLLNSCLRSDTIYQEFLLYYQPIVNVNTKEITAMEALLRWQHPELGLVPPEDFLRLAENNNRINPIGDWVLRNACKQFVEWNAQGFHLRSIAVNVSLRQLENSNFSYRVSQILQEFKMESSSLILEVSESVLLPKLNLVEKTLHMLKHLGVQIAIDDFGTGYLSLQHLRRFPVNCLKIDNILIKEMMIDSESEAITRTIVSLAKSLRLETVAEGVESEKQKNMLKEYGCLLMQGYLFCRPLLPNEFTRPLLKTISEHV